MKIRSDFVTNSSSSSFIITNNSDETLTSREVVEKLLSKILTTSENLFTLAPGESIEYECSDDTCDGAFENWVHNTFDSWGVPSCYDTSEVDIQFSESHH